MSNCGRYDKKSFINNYICLKKGINTGNSIKLPYQYSPSDTGHQDLKHQQNYCNSISKSSPYLCFKKGLEIGKKNQYEKNKFKIKENFIQYVSDENSNDSIEHVRCQNMILFIAVFIGLTTFGLFIAFEIYWLWAIIIGILSSSLFLYFCNYQS